MTSSLVGSEMCIRDSVLLLARKCADKGVSLAAIQEGCWRTTGCSPCLLYTSDAADDMQCVCSV
eukprot:1055298-Prorocentrum_lima.AAC.1